MVWPVNEYAWDSPHVKTHMLFQAHFGRLELPISDYFTDLKSVLDQAVRILQALVDVLAEAQWLSTCRMAMSITQMVIQGRFITDPSHINLPHMSERLINALWEIGIQSLPEIMYADRKLLKQIASRCGLSEKPIQELLDVINRLPVVNMGLDATIFSENDNNQRKVSLIQQQQEGVISQDGQQSKVSSLVVSPLPTPVSITVPMGSPIELHIHLDRQSAGRTLGLSTSIPSNSLLRVHAPAFPKPKDEGWWLLVGEDERDELLTVKRLAGLKYKLTSTLRIEAPMEVGQHVISVYLISDSYIGLDQHISFILNVTSKGDGPEGQ